MNKSTSPPEVWTAAGVSLFSSVFSTGCFCSVFVVVTIEEAVSAFLDKYKESVEYVNANNDDAATLIEKFDIVPAAVAKKALPSCNITFIAGDEMQKKLSGYLSILSAQNPNSVGGALPNEDFYFKK